MKAALFITLSAALLGVAAPWQNGTSLIAAPARAGGDSDVAGLTLRLPERRTDVMLEVTTGPLPNGTELVLETADGRVLGAVAFFGQLNPADIQRHQIIVRRGDLPAGEINLVGRVMTKGEARAARSDELIAVTVLDQ